MIGKPFSAACERNQQFIVEQLKPLLATAKRVLEIGSGTGQHAVFFAKNLPHLLWQTSDLDIQHAGINLWINESQLTNVLKPLSLNVNTDPLPDNDYDAIYTANTFHIMSWETVKRCIQKVGHSLTDGGLFIVYGPFIFDGIELAPSNVNFDTMLKAQHPDQGLRSFEEIIQIARKVDLEHKETIPLPANNVLLIFKKTGLYSRST